MSALLAVANSAREEAEPPLAAPNRMGHSVFSKSATPTQLHNGATSR